MPTPRPSIVPSVGAIDGTSITWPSRPIRLRPATRPKIAVTIGSGIATSGPEGERRTTIATASPIASLDSVAGLETSCPR